MVPVEKGLRFVCSDGYEVVNPGRVIVGKGPQLKETSEPYLKAASENFQPVDPLAEPDLYLRFAELDSTPEAFLGFADSYGFLLGETFATTQFSRIEPLTHWKSEQDNLKRTVRAWEIVSNEDLEALEQYLHVGEDGRIFYQDQLGFDSLSKDDFRLSGTEGDELGRHLRSLAIIVRRWVNARLKSEVAPQLARSESGGSNRSTLVLAPQSLAGALWLELAHDMTGSKPLKRCSVCGRWYQPARPSKGLYCSGACRQKAYRDRQT